MENLENDSENTPKSPELLEIEKKIDSLAAEIKSYIENSRNSEMTRLHSRLDEKVWREVSSKFGELAEEIAQDKEVRTFLGFESGNSEEILDWLNREKISAYEFFEKPPQGDSQQGVKDWIVRRRSNDSRAIPRRTSPNYQVDERNYKADHGLYEIVGRVLKYNWKDDPSYSKDSNDYKKLGVIEELRALN